MEFEYDPGKSASNKAKHGIDFDRAQLLWRDPYLMEIRARTTDEPRHLVVGRLFDRHYSAIITYRENRVRIISGRRSRQSEVDLYEQAR